VSITSELGAIIISTFIILVFIAVLGEEVKEIYKRVRRLEKKLEDSIEELEDIKQLVDKSVVHVIDEIKFRCGEDDKQQ